LYYVYKKYKVILKITEKNKKNINNKRITEIHSWLTHTFFFMKTIYNLFRRQSYC